WSGELNGKRYDISYQRVKGKNVVTTNGVETVVKAGFMSSLMSFDEPFTFDNINARLVVVKGKPEVVVNDVYLQSGKPYQKRPDWLIVFVILCLLIPIVNLGGFLPIALALAGIALCSAVSRSEWSTKVKVLVCTLITVADWLIFFLVAVGFAFLAL
ncbi:MAG: hypothetical protein LBV33_04040, partial [Lachnospiraceae bacterium]|nr:hypothetical protein [Lachnospiraceae bacterium]